jgi:hypothetical protein
MDLQRSEPNDHVPRQPCEPKLNEWRITTLDLANSSHPSLHFRLIA